jgi:hypothetical protein
MNDNFHQKTSHAGGQFMKKTLITGVVSAVVCSMAMVGNAMALSMSLFDSTSTVTVSDAGFGNLNSTKGGLAFIEDMDRWKTNVSSGVSNPIIGTVANQALDLNTLDISSSSGGMLTISLWEPYTEVGDPNAGITSFISRGGGTSNGSVDISYFVNGTQITLNSLDTVKPGGAALVGSTFLAEIPTDVPYRLKVITTVVDKISNDTSFSAEAKDPKPATMLLFNTGLLVLTGISRTKTSKKNCIYLYKQKIITY